MSNATEQRKMAFYNDLHNKYGFHYPKELEVGKDDTHIEAFTGEDLKFYERGDKFLFDQFGFWVVKKVGGKFWAIVGNEDELFKTAEKAFDWVRERM